MDDLKERLRAGCPSGCGSMTECACATMADALARIEELERGATPWSRAIHDKLVEFQAHRDGVQTYIQPRTPAHVATLAKRLLDAVYIEGVGNPYVSPCSNGDVQLDWHGNGWNIELTIGQGFNVEMWVSRPGEEGGKYFTGFSDFAWSLQLLVKRD